MADAAAPLLLGLTPEELMSDPVWGSLGPDDRGYVVDQWAMENKAASPDVSAEELRSFNGVVDEFREAASAGFGEKAGAFLGGVAKSIPRSLAASAVAMPAYAGQAGRVIGGELAGAAPGTMVREAPLLTKTILATPAHAENIGHWVERKFGGAKARQYETLQGKLDALRTQLLDGEEDPRETKSLAAQVSVAAAGYNGDEPTGYLYAGEADGFQDPAGFADRVKRERQPFATETGLRDADLRGTRTIHADPENLALASAFRQTRNPAYFDELAKRLTASDAELRRASVPYANEMGDQATYEKAWGDLAPLRYVRGAIYEQADSPIDTALSLTGVGGLFRGVKAAAKGGLTLSGIGRGALKAAAIEAPTGAAAAVGENKLASGGEVATEAAAEVLGEAGGAAAGYAGGKVMRAVAKPFAESPATRAAKAVARELDRAQLDDAGLPIGEGEISTALLPEVLGEVGSGNAEVGSGVEVPAVEGSRQPVYTPPEQAPVETTAAVTAATEVDPLGTVPEMPATLAEQRQRVVEGSKPAMLFPGVAVSDVPAEYRPRENEPFALTDTAAGAMLHPNDVEPARVAKAVEDGLLGEMLGYGVAEKPREAAGALVLRNAAGTEVDAVAVDAATAPQVEAALRARMREGDTVTAENIPDVLAGRVAQKKPAPTRTSAAVAGPSLTPEAVRSEASPSVEGMGGEGQVKPAAGPGASALEEWGERGFGQRLKVDERLREAWRSEMQPGQYKRFTEQGLNEATNRFIAQEGLPRATALFLDGASGLSGHERNAIGMQVALKLDTLAREAEVKGDAPALANIEATFDEVTGVLESLATDAAQALRSFGMWANMTPEGIMKRMAREYHRKYPDKPMPQMPEELKRKISELARRSRAAPAGSFIRADLNRQIMAEAARWQGMSVMDIATAFWYANVLSGPSTHAVNIAGSGTHLLARMATAAVSEHPRDTVAMVRGLIEGIRIGAFDTAAAARGEALTGTAVDKFDQRQVLELLHTENPKTLKQYAGNAIALGRYVGRMLTAQDAFWKGTARSAAEWLAASRLARQGVKEGQGDYATQLATQLANGPAKAAAAQKQAADELRAAGRPLATRDLARREWEIMQEQRPAAVRGEGERFGEVATFNNLPEGSLGWVAKMLNGFNRETVVDTPAGEIPIARLFGFPFVNVVANVFSHGLDFTPIGIARAAKGAHLAGRKKNLMPFSAAERRQRLAAGIAGTAAFTALIWMGASAVGEEDPWFTLTDGGPKDPNKVKQLRERGWRPWSFKFGNTYVSFQELPGAPMFAVAASMISSLREDPMGVKSELGPRITKALMMAVSSLQDMSFLSNVGTIWKAFEQRNEKLALQAVTRPVKGFVPAAGLLRDIARVTDPNATDASTLRGQLVQNIPVLQGYGTRPALNAFGEPVTLQTIQRIPGLARFVSRERKDPEAEWLGKHGLFISDINDSATISLPSASAAEKYTVQKLREQRAALLGRAYAEKMKPEEAHAYAKAAGPLVRQAVKQARHEAMQHPDWDQEQIADKLNTWVKAARKTAKRQMFDQMLKGR